MLPLTSDSPTQFFVPFSGSLSLRDGWRALIDARAGVLGGVAVIAAVIRVLIGTQAASTLIVGIGLAAAIVGLVLIYARLRLHNAGLFLQGSTVGVADAFGRRKGVKVDRLDGIRLCSVAPKNVATPTQIILFVEHNGRVALRFYGANGLVSGGIEELARRAGIPMVGSFDDRYQPAELGKLYPSALPAVQRASYAVLEHPTITAWVTVGLTIAAFVVLAIVLLSKGPR